MSVLTQFAQNVTPISNLQGACEFKFGAKFLEVVGERWSWYHWKGDIPKICFSLG